MEHEISVRFAWEPVGAITGTGTGLAWPPMPTGNGVYRFTLRLGARTRYYVGETDNYRRRFAHYAKPGPSQTTNIKMHARLLELLNVKGGTADLQVPTGVTVLRDGQPLPTDELPDIFVRRLLENAALLEVAALNGEIINGRGFPSGEL